MSPQSPHEKSTDIEIEFRLALNTPDQDRFVLNIETRLPGTGITAIFGRSGSGKTSLLRAVAGLEKPQSGRIVVANQVWQDATTFMPTHERSLGYVFQEASLFAHMNIAQNLRYTMQRAAEPVSDALYGRIIEILDIGELGQRRPSQCSGGERQRVAIARALLRQPQLLLMDEPLASLDSSRKQQIMDYIVKLREETNIPVLYVTHSLDEVARLANHVVVLEAGQLIAQGGLTEVFNRADLPLPQDQELGAIFDGVVAECDQQWHLNKVDIGHGQHLWVRAGSEAEGAKVRVRVLARDVSITLSSQHDSSIQNRLRAEVSDVQDDTDAAFCILKLKVGASLILARLTKKSLSQLNVQSGSQVWAQIKSVAVLA